MFAILTDGSVVFDRLIKYSWWYWSNKYSRTTGGGNDELNADSGKSIKLLKFIKHGLVWSNV